MHLLLGSIDGRFRVSFSLNSGFVQIASALEWLQGIGCAALGNLLRWSGAGFVFCVTAVWGNDTVTQAQDLWALWRLARHQQNNVARMALIDCPECGKQVSTEARACPNCGYPVAARLGDKQSTPGAVAKSKSASILAEVRPSWWGYFWYLFFFWLIVPPLVAYFRRASTVLRIYPERITVERGLFSKCYQDYNPRDIRSIDIDQGFFQRVIGIGDLTISTAASAEASERLNAIPDPKGVRDLILAQRGGGSVE
jgi:hypothetical protein